MWIRRKKRADFSCKKAKAVLTWLSFAPGGGLEEGKKLGNKKSALGPS